MAPRWWGAVVWEVLRRHSPGAAVAVAVVVVVRRIRTRREDKP